MQPYLSIPPGICPSIKKGLKYNTIVVGIRKMGKKYPGWFLGLFFFQPLFLHSEEINPVNFQEVVQEVQEKKGEILQMIQEVEPLREERTLRCLREKLKEISQLEQALTVVIKEYQLFLTQEKGFQKIGYIVPAKTKEDMVRALVSAPEMAQKIVDSARLCFVSEGGVPEPLTEKKPDEEDTPEWLPLPIPPISQIIEPSPEDRPFSPVVR